jgi:hypothetical protein
MILGARPTCGGYPPRPQISHCDWSKTVPIHPELLTAIAGHAIVEKAEQLGTYLGVGCDAISLAAFLSRAASKLGMPIHIDVATNTIDADQTIASQIADIDRTGVQWVNTSRELSGPDGVLFGANGVLILTDESARLRELVLAASRKVSGIFGFALSVWSFTETAPNTSIGPTLSLTSIAAQRNFCGYGRRFGRLRNATDDPQVVAAKKSLETFLKTLLPATPFDDAVLGLIPERLCPDEMLLVHRICCTLATVRGTVELEGCVRFQVLAEDYQVARRLLRHLPITPRQGALSARAVETARRMLERLQEPAFQILIEGRSDSGQQLYTTREAAEAAGISYNAAKDHLAELERGGFVRSTRRAEERDRGRSIYFEFEVDEAPVFGQQNPFFLLEEIAAD